jgi:hypothetical protein
MYAYETGTGWLFGSIESVGDVGFRPSLAVNPSGFPVVSYYSATLGDLRYASSTIAKLLYLPLLLR